MKTGKELADSIEQYKQKLISEGWKEGSVHFNSLMKLHEMLESTPEEQLKKDWEEVEKMELQGPTVEEYFEFLAQNSRNDRH